MTEKQRWTDPLGQLPDNLPVIQKDAEDYGKRECPDCHGEGARPFPGYSISPFTGTPVIDPQAEDWKTCPTCNGTGRIRL